MEIERVRKLRVNKHTVRSLTPEEIDDVSGAQLIRYLTMIPASMVCTITYGGCGMTVGCGPTAGCNATDVCGTTTGGETSYCG